MAANGCPPFEELESTILVPLAPELKRGGKRPSPFKNPDFYLALHKILYEDYKGCYDKKEIAARYGFKRPYHLDEYIKKAKRYAEERKARGPSADLPQAPPGAGEGVEEEEGEEVVPAEALQQEKVAALQEPPAPPEEITGKRLMKALEPIIARYFGKEADRLTAEYISNIFAVGAQFEVKYAPWCLQVGGMDRISCVTKALDFYIKYRDLVSQYEAAIEELSARYAAALKLIASIIAQEPSYIVPVIKAKMLKSVLRELARVGPKLDMGTVEKVLELAEKAFGEVM